MVDISTGPGTGAIELPQDARGAESRRDPLATLDDATRRDVQMVVALAVRVVLGALAGWLIGFVAALLGPDVLPIFGASAGMAAGAVSAYLKLRPETARRD